MQLAKVLFILVAGAVASCEGADSSLRTSVKQAKECAPPCKIVGQWPSWACCCDCP
jgi:hypothetical protein